jgi:MFS family permease
VGTWITRLATAWLVWRLTQSAAMLGLVGFVGQIPTFVLAPFAGVWVDRLDRYRVLLTAQSFACLQSFALAALTLAGAVQVWHVLVLQALQGCINAFDAPSRQALLVDLLEDQGDLANAIALNSTMVNGARLVGPSIAGLLVALVGEGWCFLLDGVTYFAVIASLLAMRLPGRERRAVETKVLQDLVDGFRYAFGFAPVRALLLLLALVSVAGMPYTVLLPVIAERTLGGIGAVAGALHLASRTTVVGLGRLIPRAAALFGASLAALGLSRSFPLSFAVMVPAGFGFMIQMASSNTVIQTLVREEMRGRVMAFYAMAFIGMMPFGSLFAGWVATRIGAPTTLVWGGVICIGGAIFFGRRLPRLRQIVRPIYVERGILPEVASGIGAATSLRDETD